LSNFIDALHTTASDPDCVYSDFGNFKLEFDVHSKIIMLQLILYIVVIVDC